MPITASVYSKIHKKDCRNTVQFDLMHDYYSSFFFSFEFSRLQRDHALYSNGENEMRINRRREFYIGLRNTGERQRSPSVRTMSLARPNSRRHYTLPGEFLSIPERGCINAFFKLKIPFKPWLPALFPRRSAPENYFPQYRRLSRSSRACLSPFLPAILLFIPDTRDFQEGTIEETRKWTSKSNFSDEFPSETYSHSIRSRELSSFNDRIKL